MKRKWFSPALYLEGMRQLRLLGILFTAAASLVALFNPFGEYLSTLGMKGTPQIQDVTCLQMNPLLILSFCIVAPLLTLSAFSFLNKRESSDFYHAIPATRQCLFFSFFAAVITWLFIYMAVSTGLAIAGHALFPKLFAVHYGNVLRTFFNCFAAGTLVAACVATAMSVTGTFLTNVLISLIIIFLPRLLIHGIIENIGYAFPLVDGLDFAPFFSMQYNIPAGYVLQYFVTFDADNILTNFSSGLCTLGLSLVYIVIAALLFTRRKSEGAAQSAPNRYLQGLFRFLVGFTISSLITLSLFNEIIHGYLDAETIFGWFFLYVIAVFVMLAFELLCTRRFRGLIRRGAITLGLLVIANVTLLGIIFGVNQSLHHYTPSAEEITAVRVRSNSSYGYYDEHDYFSEQSQKIDITDPAFCKLISKRLQYTVDMLEISENKYHEEMGNNYSVVVNIKSGGRYHPRRIIFTSEDLEALSAALNKQEAFRNVYMRLPTSYAYISSSHLHLETGMQASTLMDTLQEEVNEIGFETWYSVLNGTYAEENPNISAIDSLWMRISEDSDWSSIPIPLYSSVLPRTCNAYIALCNDESISSRNEVLNALINDPSSLGWVNADVYNSDGSVASRYWWDQTTISGNKEAFMLMATALKDYQPASIDSTKPFLFLSVELFDPADKGTEWYGYKSTNCFCYFALPEDIIFPEEK